MSLGAGIKGGSLHGTLSPSRTPMDGSQVSLAIPIALPVFVLLRVNSTLFVEYLFQDSFSHLPHKRYNMAESSQGTTKETTEYVIKAAMRNSMEAE